MYCRRSGYGRLDVALVHMNRLYNAALQERRDAYKMRRESVSYYDQCKQVTGLRADDPAYASYSLQLERGALMAVSEAFEGFFSRTSRGEKPGYPRFRPASRARTLRVAEASAAMVKRSGSGYRVVVKGLPPVRLRPSRELPPPGGLKTVRFTKTARGWYANLTYAEEFAPLPATGERVGMDWGVSARLTLSDGGIEPAVKPDYRRAKRLQRMLARAERGSGGRARKRLAYARERERMAVSERNRTHGLTTWLVRRYDLMGLEALAVRNMSASGGSRKRGLNRGMMENRYGQIRRQLVYKAEWAGRILSLVEPRYTSRDCSGCGARRKMELSQRLYECAECGMEMDRDLNAAKNVLHRAMALQGRDCSLGGLRDGTEPTPLGAVAA